MKQTLYFEHLQSALCAQNNMRTIDGIEADGPGEIDQDGYYAVSWSTEDALQHAQKGRIIRTYQPDGVDFNRSHEQQPDGVAPWILQLQPTNRLDEGFHGTSEKCDYAQPIDEQTQVRDYRYTDDPTYGQFNL